MLFIGDSDSKESTGNVGDLGSIPRLGRSPGGGNSYPLQYSDLENSVGCTVNGVTKSWTRLNDFDFSTVNGTRYSTVFTLAGQLQIVIPTVLVICCCITSYHRTNWAETILTTYHRTHFVGVRNLEAV